MLTFYFLTGGGAEITVSSSSATPHYLRLNPSGGVPHLLQQSAPH